MGILCVQSLFCSSVPFAPFPMSPRASLPSESRYRFVLYALSPRDGGWMRWGGWDSFQTKADCWDFVFLMRPLWEEADDYWGFKVVRITTRRMSSRRMIPRTLTLTGARARACVRACVFKGVCDSHNIPSKVREVILSFITKPCSRVSSLVHRHSRD